MCAWQATLRFEGENKLVHTEKGKVDSTITREATDANSITLVSIISQAREVQRLLK